MFGANQMSKHPLHSGILYPWRMMQTGTLTALSTIKIHVFAKHVCLNSAYAIISMQSVHSRCKRFVLVNLEGTQYQRIFNSGSHENRLHGDHAKLGIVIPLFLISVSAYIALTIGEIMQSINGHDHLP